MGFIAGELLLGIQSQAVNPPEFADIIGHKRKAIGNGLSSNLKKPYPAGTSCGRAKRV
jgi:hypothetical protein